MEGNATCRHEPCHIRCLGVAIETRRKTGYCECAFRSASAARALARRQLVTIQSTQARARRAAKRSGLLRAGVWPCPRKRYRMIRVFEAHENFRDVGVRKIAVALWPRRRRVAAASRSVICDPLFRFSALLSTIHLFDSFAQLSAAGASRHAELSALCSWVSRSFSDAFLPLTFS